MNYLNTYLVRAEVSVAPIVSDALCSHFLSPCKRPRLSKSERRLSSALARLVCIWRPSVRTYRMSACVIWFSARITGKTPETPASRQSYQSPSS